MPRGSRGFKFTASNTASVDVINFPHTEEWGVQGRTRLEAIIGEAAPGAAVSQGPTTAVLEQAPGLSVTQFTFDVVSGPYCDVATESAGSDWNDIANSEGAEDGTFASLEEGIVLTQGTLINDFPDFFEKDQLTIDQVELTFYYRLSEFLLAGSTLQLQYRIGAIGTPEVLKTMSGGVIEVTNEDHLAGETFDITADRTWAWADLDALQALYVGTILVDAGLAEVVVDATRLTVTASLTWNP